MSEALIELRQFIGWWRDAAPDAHTSSVYNGERAIYSSDFSAFTKRPYCPSVLRFSGPKIPYFRHRLSICTSATAYSGTLFSLRWSAMEYRRCQPPFFGDLHQEISRSWKQPFSSRLTNAAAADFTNLVGSVEQSYTAMPVVEDTLASHLSPSLAPSWKSRPLLPTKPCRTTSALIGKSYIAAGQASMALHTMAILQAYQADVLKEMDEGTGLTLWKSCAEPLIWLSEPLSTPHAPWGALWQVQWPQNAIYGWISPRFVKRRRCSCWMHPSHSLGYSGRRLAR